MNILPLGIDVAKLKSNVCLIRDDGRLGHKVFANTQLGFSQLSAWLASHHVETLHACMESTGTYGEALANYLADAGCRVSVINPAAIKSYAGCQLSRTKTDKVDAELIARLRPDPAAATLDAARPGNTHPSGVSAPPRLTDRDAHDGSQSPLVRRRRRGRRGLDPQSARSPFTCSPQRNREG